ncbi:NADH dehydrogenase [ubiquinone] 1 alpha subcomplex subunit 10, mitochondrial-like [Cylas formicarius]|uniref:NADH dehydrogenase [ubiquinone] 1 alpha subcomplex subunit 10, mitochondrial-like n=1 Tax=Cylas formicarius TaxID=197179 RepID=UPI002958BE66|nr:NADH dehydrogenase [ubiquinone] 1 alpha subcomplex subunit 10, mitochondrial-like [Cylas formicarius]XP_060531613.1 NADH dehydrogenase [ubiquinone] 1 alpha subcomplex subunit 10, mitochondrial-like [Cylas formicarius]
MGSLARISLNKLGGCKSIKILHLKHGVRTITSKLDQLPPKPKPWPYNEKKFTMLNFFFDKTSARLDENSKLVVVEGPVAAGKTKVAKQIANTFNMLYLPEANLDMFYINSYGYDLRKLDPMLPEDCRTFDVMDFLKNPRHKLVARMQIEQFRAKYSQYIDALAHILSTGQGVVLDRCVYSDFVFAESMFSQGYISKAARKKYYEVRDNCIGELLRPHLVIYLDVPVPNVLDNIKKRAVGWEKNSQVLNEKYLEVMEYNYKQSYLRRMGEHAELLIYDWSVEGDLEIVLEDIEQIDFDKYDYQDPHMKDWYLKLEEDYACLRHLYADKKYNLMAYSTSVPMTGAPELLVDAEDADQYHKILATAPGEQYAPGYNKALGDTGILFKMDRHQRDTLPLTERRLHYL